MTETISSISTMTADRDMTHAECLAAIRFNGMKLGDYDLGEPKAHFVSTLEKKPFETIKKGERYIREVYWDAPEGSGALLKGELG